MFKMLKLKDANVILKSQRGMSLVEILIALTLLGIAGTFVVGQVTQNLQEGQVQSAKIQIQKIGDILREYKRKCGRYPTTEQGLDALVAAPTSGKTCKRYPPDGFIEGRVPKDPWDTEFIYESDGKRYEIISLGGDEEEGGEDEIDKDISSKDL
jgi:general secretion pathway protein G